MYLVNLTDIEKNYFYKIAAKVIEQSSCLSINDSALLEEYCKELGLDYESCCIESFNDEKLNTILSRITRKEARRIIYLEIIGLFLADGRFSDFEKNVAKNIEKEFYIDKEVADGLRRVAEGMLQLYKEGSKMIAS